MSEHTVRRLTVEDLAALLALQKHVLPDTMSARLGQRFNEVYHETMLASDDYMCDGYFVDRQLVGYLSYTADTMQLLRGVFRHNLIKYAGALLVDLARDPRVLRPILRVARSVVGPGTQATPRITAELLSVGVLPTLRGARGNSVERRSVADVLLSSALTALRSRGVDTLHLVAKPVHVDPVPHRFVRKYGFIGAGSVRRFGIEAEMYVLKLTNTAQPTEPQ